MLLQERITAVFKLADKLATFKAKLELWKQQRNTGTSDTVQTLVEILKQTESGPSFSWLMHDHLALLSKV